MKLKESVKGGKEVRGHTGPSPAKPLNCGQDPNLCSDCLQDNSCLRQRPGSPGSPVTPGNRVAICAAHEGLSVPQPTHGHRGLDNTAKPGGMLRTEKDLMQMKGSGRFQEILPFEKPR